MWALVSVSVYGMNKKLNLEAYSHKLTQNAYTFPSKSIASCLLILMHLYMYLFSVFDCCCVLYTEVIRSILSLSFFLWRQPKTATANKNKIHIVAYTLYMQCMIKLGQQQQQEKNDEVMFLSIDTEHTFPNNESFSETHT